MKANIDSKGNLTIAIEDVLDRMDGDALASLADSLACTDAVIKNVVDQITEGATDLGSWVSDQHGRAEPSSPMGVFRRRLAMAASAEADTQIAKLAANLKTAEDKIRRMSNAAQGFRDRVPSAWEAIHRAEFADHYKTTNEGSDQ